MKRFIILVVCLILIGVFTRIINNSLLTYSGEMLEPRAAHSSIVLEDKQSILYVGGAEDFFTYSKTAELFNLKQKKSENFYKLKLEHVEPSLFKNSNGEFVIIDINGIEKLNLEKKESELIEKNPFNLDYYAGTMQSIQISNDKILITGGLTGGKSEILKNGNIKNKIPGIPTSSAYIYDIKDFKIIKNLKMNYPHSEHTLVKLDNGNILIIGGNSTTKTGALSVEEFNINTNTFKTIANLKRTRKNVLPVKIGNYIYLLGGYDFDKENWLSNNIKVKNKSKSIEIINIDNYKVLTDEFKPNLFVNTSNTFAFAMNTDNIILITSPNKVQASKYCLYSLKDNKCLKLKNLDVSYKPNVTKIKNNIYISGGSRKLNLISRNFVSGDCEYGRVCVYNPKRKKVVKLK